VESGKWKVESGKWKVESGKWKVESGKWRKTHPALREPLPGEDEFENKYSLIEYKNTNEKF